MVAGVVRRGQRRRRGPARRGDHQRGHQCLGGQGGRRASAWWPRARAPGDLQGGGACGLWLPRGRAGPRAGRRRGARVRVGARARAAGVGLRAQPDLALPEAREPRQGGLHPPRPAVAGALCRRGRRARVRGRHRAHAEALPGAGVAGRRHPLQRRQPGHRRRLRRGGPRAARRAGRPRCAARAARQPHRPEPQLRRALSARGRAGGAGHGSGLGGPPRRLRAGKQLVRERGRRLLCRRLLFRGGGAGDAGGRGRRHAARPLR
mmetsp:Transcript_7520/g.20131  ORF Transcript_7520/g.20131 Transcript_7520/m.20131 type:complete len:263 (+) Transcript_7520:595-1383(+)